MDNTHKDIMVGDTLIKYIHPFVHPHNGEQVDGFWSAEGFPGCAADNPQSVLVNVQRRLQNEIAQLNKSLDKVNKYLAKTKNK